MRVLATKHNALTIPGIGRDPMLCGMGLTSEYLTYHGSSPLTSFSIAFFVVGPSLPDDDSSVFAGKEVSVRKETDCSSSLFTVP